jgi:hypothetical protein
LRGDDGKRGGVGGEDRFRITAPGHEQIVTGFDEAERTADALAQQLSKTLPPPSVP